MTAKEVKTRLRAYRHIQSECDSLKRRIELKKADMNYLQAIVIDGVPRSRDISRSVESAVEHMDLLVREYVAMVNTCEDAEKRILDMIHTVSDPLGRTILTRHYINGIPLNWKIYDELGISCSTMFNYYNGAIREICKNWIELEY